jgi:hypothetical protein
MGGDMDRPLDDATLPEIGIPDIDENGARAPAEEGEKLLVRDGRGLDHFKTVYEKVE